MAFSEGNNLPSSFTLVYLLLSLFCSYCQMAPAVLSDARGWDLGNGLNYDMTTTLMFREVTPGVNGDVGFQLTGRLVATAIWRDPSDYHSVLLKLQLIDPTLWIRSRKAPEPEGFVEHASEVDKVARKPIILLWRNGDIKGLFLDKSESVSALNLKRGLASAFQYKTLDVEVMERDASGLCNVTYVSAGTHVIHKRKTLCKHDTLPLGNSHTTQILGVNVNSLRNSTYELTDNLLPRTIIDEEYHNTVLKVHPSVGTFVSSYRSLKLLPDVSKLDVVQANTLKEAVASVESTYEQVPIDLQLEPTTCPDSGCTTLEKAVEENRAGLEDSALGTSKSALAFLRIVPLVRTASTEQLVKLLKSSSNNNIKTQLLDILGAAATIEAHHAAMKILKQDPDGDDTERYLWSLSMAPIPNAEIFKDVLKRSEETLQSEKVSETMALTAGAIARQIGTPSVVEKARVSLEIGIDTCREEECKLKFLRGLRNLRSKAAIPTLLKFAVGPSKASSTVAWKALYDLPKQYITDEVKRAAIRTFYQINGPRRDNSVMTLALDVILENDPTVEVLQDLISYLTEKNSVYEVRKYLSQRLEQLALKHLEFSEKFQRAFELQSHIKRNYDVMALKGLSTAFTRHFLRSTGSNGSLVTVQEVSSGLLKRGIVDVVMQTGEHEEALFSLGLFASGLSSIISSDEENNGLPEEESATAGMEIALLGVGVRPFTFFYGQGELMGHVWSGTASERTPAFQALVSLHRHDSVVTLASGFVANLEVDGAVSFDLAGQIQLSLWSRNAQSMVEMNAGIAIRGGTTVRTNFVHSSAEFLMTLEPKLQLATDVDFSSKVSLCMRLTQPEDTVKHQFYKIERIPGSRHRLRKTRRLRLPSPAKSYLLNRKNNEMCSKLFS